MPLEPKFSANIAMFVRLFLIFKLQSVSCVVFLKLCEREIDHSWQRLTYKDC